MFCRHLTRPERAMLLHALRVSAGADAAFLAIAGKLGSETDPAMTARVDLRRVEAIHLASIIDLAEDVDCWMPAD